MGDTRFTLKEMAKAKEELETLFAAPEQVNVIHYSCESFLGDNAHSPRIAAIVIMNLKTKQSVSFSLFQEAERAKIIPEHIKQYIEKLEIAMLTAFYDYIAQHPQSLWLHWNMRDSKYGFEALQDRFTALGGTPVVIDSRQKYDLPQILGCLSGRKPGERLRLMTYIEANNLSRDDMMTGEEEAKAFDRREFRRLKDSAINKVRAISRIALLARSGTLLPKVPLWSKQGLRLGLWVDEITNHLLFKVTGIIGALFLFYEIWEALQSLNLP